MGSLLVHYGGKNSGKGIDRTAGKNRWKKPLEKANRRQTGISEIETPVRHP
jgi:hypothetical protein